MPKAFVIGFSVDVSVAGKCAGNAVIRHFRVVVEEVTSAYLAFDGPFGEAWARVIDDPEQGAMAYGPDRPATWTAPLREERVIALAIRGYINAEHRRFELLPNGREIINIGTVKRED